MSYTLRPTFTSHGKRIGRPPDNGVESQRQIDRRANALEMFDKFCETQQLRIMRLSQEYGENTFVDAEEIHRQYRTMRLGTYFNGLDKQDSNIHIASYT